MCPKFNERAMDMTDVEQIEQGQTNTPQMTIIMHIIEIKSVRTARDFPHTKENSICVSFFTLINI